jgi:hypothetical protein
MVAITAEQRALTAAFIATRAAAAEACAGPTGWTGSSCASSSGGGCGYQGRSRQRTMHGAVQPNPVGASSNGGGGAASGGGAEGKQLRG